MNAETHLSEKLRSLNENDLTVNYIVPLLTRMNFYNVEFNGGPSEEGKDLIFWDIDRMGKKILYLAQVKHFKFSSKASSSRSLQTVVNQLGNCFLRKILHSDGEARFPSHVYLISTHPIDHRSLKSQFESSFSLREREIHIIDGIELAEMFLRIAPDLVRKLIHDNFALVEAKMEPSLDNRILLEALAFNGRKDIRQIFTDIDFSLGKRTTKMLFSSEFKSTSKKIKIAGHDWGAFLETWILVKAVYPNPALDLEIVKFEPLFNSYSDSHRQWQNELNEIQLLSEKKQEERRRLLDQLGPMARHRTSQEQRSGINLKKNSIEVDDKIKQLDKVEKEIIELNGEFNDQKSREPVAEFELSVDSEIFVNQLDKKRIWIEGEIKEINSNPVKSELLKSFLLTCKHIFEATDLLLKNRTFLGCISIEGASEIRVNFEQTRLRMTLDHVIDTGINLIVLGDAGAGKSTTLQMYARTRLSSGKKSIYFIPLAQISKSIGNINIELSIHEKVEKFEFAIVKYFQDIGLSLDYGAFVGNINNFDLVLLLDGLDEVIKIAPWLPSAIEQMAKRYPDTVQIVVSSRFSGDFLGEISFFPVSILRFTNEQRDNFITKWFEDTTSREVVSRIKEHLRKNPAIGKIVTSPLLATILCVLGENGVALPSSEINLYADRMKLLTGYYDSVKQIRSRISFTPHQLERCAQKLAYYMHLNNMRQISAEDIEHMLTATPFAVQAGLTKDDARKAVKELFEPCNVIVPIQENGALGFEHLKYQEHLAAREILENRAIDVLPLLKHPWWREVMLLVSRMSENIEWLIKIVGEAGASSSQLAILDDMISLRPKLEREVIQDKLDKYRFMDGTLSVEKLLNGGFEGEPYIENLPPRWLTRKT